MWQAGSYPLLNSNTLPVAWRERLKPLLDETCSMHSKTSFPSGRLEKMERLRPASAQEDIRRSPAQSKIGLVAQRVLSKGGRWTSCSYS